MGENIFHKQREIDFSPDTQMLQGLGADGRAEKGGEVPLGESSWGEAVPHPGVLSPATGTTEVRVNHLHGKESVSVHLIHRSPTQHWSFSVPGAPPASDA